MLSPSTNVVPLPVSNSGCLFCLGVVVVVVFSFVFVVVVVWVGLFLFWFLVVVFCFVCFLFAFLRPQISDVITQAERVLNTYSCNLLALSLERFQNQFFKSSSCWYKYRGFRYLNSIMCKLSMPLSESANRAMTSKANRLA